MDDILEFEHEILMDETSDEEKAELFTPTVYDSMTPKELAAYQKRMSDIDNRYYWPEKDCMVYAGDEGIEELIKAKKVIPFREYRHDLLAQLVHQYRSGTQKEYGMSLPPLLFKQLGTAPMAVPYLKVFVSASVGEEDVLHSLYTLAR